MRSLLAMVIALLMASCATTTPAPAPQVELGMQWVKHSAEYRAVTRQVYHAATRDLPRFIEDVSWNALPQQQDAATLPPAVILDVDETVVSNVDFQIEMVPPFTNDKHDQWNRENRAIPVEGVKEFVDTARDLGVTVFFVTNRPCRAKRDTDDPCPQRQTTIDDIAEVGIETDADHVLLSEERGWTREKLTRRLYVAKTHRVIMVIGDDFGDFVECARENVVAPCRTSGTRASRAMALDTYDHYWGNGWYILPNPMHGSWTSVL